MNKNGKELNYMSLLCLSALQLNQKSKVSELLKFKASRIFPFFTEGAYINFVALCTQLSSAQLHCFPYKAQLISKWFFGVINFLQKMNEQIRQIYLLPCNRKYNINHWGRPFNIEDWLQRGVLGRLQRSCKNGNVKMDSCTLNIFSHIMNYDKIYNQS